MDVINVVMFCLVISSDATNKFCVATLLLFLSVIFVSKCQKTLLSGS